MSRSEIILALIILAVMGGNLWFQQRNGRLTVSNERDMAQAIVREDFRIADLETRVTALESEDTVQSAGYWSYSSSDSAMVSVSIDPPQPRQPLYCHPKLHQRVCAADLEPSHYQTAQAVERAFEKYDPFWWPEHGALKVRHLSGYVTLPNHLKVNLQTGKPLQG